MAALTGARPGSHACIGKHMLEVLCKHEARTDMHSINEPIAALQHGAPPRSDPSCKCTAL